MVGTCVRASAVGFGRRPYLALRPALREAEHRMNWHTTASAHTVALWRGLVDSTDRPEGARAADEAVDELLLASVEGWRFGDHEGRGRIMLADAAGLDAVELAAVQAAALLLDSDRRRLGRCRHRGCEEVFLDWTNAATRRLCRVHTRARQ